MAFYEAHGEKGWRSLKKTIDAIADGGAPYYDEHNAKHIASLGIPCFACSPERLPELLETALKGGEMRQFEGDARQAKKSVL